MNSREHGRLPECGAKMLGDDWVVSYFHSDPKSHAFACMMACVGDSAWLVLPWGFSLVRDSLV